MRNAWAITLNLSPVQSYMKRCFCSLFVELINVENYEYYFVKGDTMSNNSAFLKMIKFNDLVAQLLNIFTGYLSVCQI